MAIYRRHVVFREHAKIDIPRAVPDNIALCVGVHSAPVRCEQRLFWAEEASDAGVTVDAGSATMKVWIEHTSDQIGARTTLLVRQCCVCFRPRVTGNTFGSLATCATRCVISSKAMAGSERMGERPPLPAACSATVRAKLGDILTCSHAVMWMSMGSQPHSSAGCLGFPKTRQWPCRRSTSESSVVSSSG
jgi:hypothetical protein